MDTNSSGNESDDEPMSTDISEDILYGSQSHSRINMRESRYNICDHIKGVQAGWKRLLSSPQFF